VCVCSWELYTIEIEIKVREKGYSQSYIINAVFPEFLQITKPFFLVLLAQMLLATTSKHITVRCETLLRV